MRERFEPKPASKQAVWWIVLAVNLAIGLGVYALDRGRQVDIHQAVKEMSDKHYAELKALNVEFTKKLEDRYVTRTELVALIGSAVNPVIERLSSTERVLIRIEQKIQ